MLQFHAKVSNEFLHWDLSGLENVTRDFEQIGIFSYMEIPDDMLDELGITTEDLRLVDKETCTGIVHEISTVRFEHVAS